MSVYGDAARILMADGREMTYHDFAVLVVEQGLAPHSGENHIHNVRGNLYWQVKAGVLIMTAPGTFRLAEVAAQPKPKAAAVKPKPKAKPKPKVKTAGKVRFAWHADKMQSALQRGGASANFQFAELAADMDSLAQFVFNYCKAKPEGVVQVEYVARFYGFSGQHQHCIIRGHKIIMNMYHFASRYISPEYGRVAQDECWLRLMHTLAHECVHAVQVSGKQLEWKHDGYKYWEGKRVCKRNYKPRKHQNYLNLPWEKDANKRGSEILAAWLEAKQGYEFTDKNKQLVASWSGGK